MTLPAKLVEHLANHKSEQMYASSAAISRISLSSRELINDCEAFNFEAAALARTVLKKIARGHFKIDFLDGFRHCRPSFAYRVKRSVGRMKGSAEAKTIACKFLIDHFSAISLERYIIENREVAAGVCWKLAFREILNGCHTYLQRLGQVSSLARLIALSELENLALAALIARSAAAQFVRTRSRWRIRTRHQAALYVLAGDPVGRIWLRECHSDAVKQAWWTKRHPQLIELNAGAVLSRREFIFQI